MDAPIPTIAPLSYHQGYALLMTYWEEKPIRATGVCGVYQTRAAVDYAYCYAYIEDALEMAEGEADDPEGLSFYEALALLTEDADYCYHTEEVPVH